MSKATEIFKLQRAVFGDCFAADLPTKYVGDVIHIVKPTAKILKFEKREKKDS